MDTFVLHSQSREWFWQSENHLEIIARQEFGLPFFQPLRAASD
jgi:hypothetical protein